MVLRVHAICCREVPVELDAGTGADASAPSEQLLPSASDAVASALASLRAQSASREQRGGGVGGAGAGAAAAASATGARGRQRSGETRRLVDDAFYRLCSLVCDGCGRVRTAAVEKLVLHSTCTGRNCWNLKKYVLPSNGVSLLQGLLKGVSLSLLDESLEKKIISDLKVLLFCLKMSFE